MFVQDLFKQLKTAPVDSFVQKYELLEADWLVDKINLTSASLIRDASSHYRQLDAKKMWQGQLNARAQVVLLTTQVKALSTQLAAVQSSKSPATSSTTTAPSQPNSSSTNQAGHTFEMWRLTKIDNGKEHSAIEKDGKTWYFCEDGHQFDGKVVGMYVLHKPGQGHLDWRKRIDERKAKRREKRAKDRAAKAGEATTAPAADGSNDKKLSLSTSLQAALTTQCGLSPEEANKLWADVCDKSGN